MIKTSEHGPVTVIRMGRSIGRFVLYPVHAFLVGDTMIDTGAPCVRRELASVLEGRIIRTVINTHQHEDHIGGNDLLQGHFGARVLAPAGALPVLKNPRLLKLRPYQRVVWGWPAPSDADPLPGVVQAGPYALKVIPSPGHTPHHVCLHEPREGWLFTGDLFCGRGFKYLRADENYSLIVETLGMLAGLDFGTIFCSLLGAVDNGRDALREKVRFMEDLSALVLDLHDKGLPPREISKRLLGGEGAMGPVTGGHYSKLNTVLSIIHNMEPENIDNKKQ
ncbi:MAG TPA: MBL fold metallo-hydrolase [Spirochaetota bacterium]|nr:MBL fold metallo-hydrolase [Spirochaetota bacterium]HOD14916.1 MBL fold metallo-hydrolase [Spirochaetota bacterium]HPG50700.1 MBL fold metallo-hydrolase [Spirochaetota bacterium]HQL82887.1 MBL fold metallo-hydrolase [Spirochaetota bacterium]